MIKIENLENKILSSAYLGLSKHGKKIYFAYKYKGIYEEGRLDLTSENYHQELLRRIEDLAKKKNIKIYAAGLVGFNDFEDIATKLWQKLDIVPKEKKSQTKENKRKALLACKSAKSLFSEDLIPNNFLDKYGAVYEQFLSDLNSYKKIAKADDWSKIEKISNKCREKNLKVAFINSTAAGGGVALMRHALIRLYSLLKVDVKWLVLIGDSRIFNVTKKKIHNVLHGVAAPDIILSQEDKDLYNDWIDKNFIKLKKALSKLDVVVIDDPQPSGLIPLIKKAFPNIKIIYRSHIQIYSKLIDKGVEQNKNTWDFVWNNAKLADIFISHPIKRFTPKDVPEAKVLYMPATTDALDGLNKKIRARDRKYYYNIFNSILVKSGLEPLDLKRPYIIQVARFDPSKGIPDLVESYRKLRKNLFKKGVPDKEMPQLVIVGNGANDDPESLPIYEEIMHTIDMDTFKKFKNDIKVARLPHNDQLLNTLLSGGTIALQLSHREGFEIKVTEALMKGVPIVAYKTGGIPLQINEGETGYLVKRGKTKEVAQLVEKLLYDKKLYKTISKQAKEQINDDYLTINSAYRWLFLSLLLSYKSDLKLTSRDFKDLENKYFDYILEA